MKLVCPACGATASREAWENDAATRQFDGLLTTLPGQVQQCVTHYLGLFRKGDRGLSWKRALKLLSALKELIERGTIQWDGGEVRPAPPELWAEVMEYMINTGKKELSDHNYLKKTVWSKAKSLAAQAERAREDGLRRGSRDEAPMGDEERGDVKAMFGKFWGNQRAFSTENGGKQ